MKAVKLTQALIKSLKQQTHSYSVWDSQVSTLGVRVCSDNQRFYIMRTRNVTQKIASVDQVTLKTARQHALKAFNASLEPSGNKSGRIIRFDALVRDEWMETVMMNWKPTSQRTGKSALKCHLLKAFGRYPVHRIDSFHVQRWFDELSQTYAGTANRNLDVLRSIFSYAVKQGYCRENPCDGIKQNRKRTLNRFLSHEELSRFYAALRVVSQVGGMEACCCQVLQLVLLTGCRISEVTGLKWSYVKGNEWHLPDSKTGAKIVYVGEAAQKLVSRIRKQEKGDLTEDVFPLLSHFVSRPNKVGIVWEQVRTLANIDDVRIHDLRHTFASYAVLEGYPIPMVAKLLGHKRISSTLRYTHVGDAHLEEEAEAIGQVITGFLTEGTCLAPKKKANIDKGKSKRVKPELVTKKLSNDVLSLTEDQVRRYRDELDFWEWD